MEKKAKMGMSALTILTIVFMALGGTFFPIGILMLVLGFKVDSEMFIMAIIFGSVGTLFLALGLLFLFMELKKRKAYSTTKIEEDLPYEKPMHRSDRDSATKQISNHFRKDWKAQHHYCLRGTAHRRCRIDELYSVLGSK